MTLKILAVDDDPVFLKLLRATLEGLGYAEVTTAASGAEALQKLSFEGDAVDCFILDIRMPEMDGISLCRHIRALPRHAATPIVMMTVLSDKASVDAAFLAGATDYLTKPIDALEVKARLGMVRRLVDERRAARQGGGETGASAPRYRFSDTLPQTMVGGSMSLLQMMNYLRTLGPFRSFHSAAVGFEVVNGREIFDILGQEGFAEVMQDVAAAVEDSLSGGNRMLAYAGAGRFVGLVPWPNRLEPEAVADALRLALDGYCGVYADLALPMPVVAVGAQIRGRLLLRSDPRALLERALDAAAAAAEDEARGRGAGALARLTA